jgi:hypothetical protein
MSSCWLEKEQQFDTMHHLKRKSGALLLAPGENRQYGPGENRQFQPNENRQCIF